MTPPAAPRTPETPLERTRRAQMERNHAMLQHFVGGGLAALADPAKTEATEPPATATATASAKRRKSTVKQTKQEAAKKATTSSKAPERKAPGRRASSAEPRSVTLVAALQDESLSNSTQTDLHKLIQEVSTLTGRCTLDAEWCEGAMRQLAGKLSVEKICTQLPTRWSKHEKRTVRVALQTVAASAAWHTTAGTATPKNTEQQQQQHSSRSAPPEATIMPSSGAGASDAALATSQPHVGPAKGTAASAAPVEASPAAPWSNNAPTAANGASWPISVSVHPFQKQTAAFGDLNAGGRQDSELVTPPVVGPASLKGAPSIVSQPVPQKRSDTSSKVAYVPPSASPPACLLYTSPSPRD